MYIEKKNVCTYTYKKEMKRNAYRKKCIYMYMRQNQKKYV